MSSPKEPPSGSIRVAIGKHKSGERTLSPFVAAERRRLGRAMALAAAADAVTAATATPPAALQDSDDDDVMITGDFGLPIDVSAAGFLPAGGAGHDNP